MLLGQIETAKLLEQCNGSRLAIEEVLSAYIVWKYLRGATSEQVLLKLGYLSRYLRLTGRSHVLEAGADAFKVLSLEVALGGGRVGLLPGETPQGKAIWNKMRRATSSLATDAVYGGPGPVQKFISLPQSEPLRRDHTRTPWAERYFIARVRFGEVPQEVLEHIRTLTAIFTTLPAYLPPYASQDNGS